MKINKEEYNGSSIIYETKTMDRQKILIATLSGILTISVIIFAYQRIMKGSEEPADMSSLQTDTKEREVAKPIPTTPGSVTDEIESETAIDDAAIDAEINAEVSDVQGDSESLNNLSQSYDENQL